MKPLHSLLFGPLVALGACAGTVTPFADAPRTAPAPTVATMESPPAALDVVPAPVTTTPVVSDSGQDKVTIQHTLHGAPELRALGRYRLVFVSRLPDQDRFLVESNHATSLRAFHQAEVSIEVGIRGHERLVFSTTYCTAFGCFRMNNGQDTWAIDGVNPGDIVTFTWGS